MFKPCVILLLVNISMQCTLTSFKNNTIEINGVNETISGCISPDTIGFKGEISRIYIKDQNIRDLNYGAVQGISSKFAIDFFDAGIEIIREGAFLHLPRLSWIFFWFNKIFWISENSFQDLPSLEGVHLVGNNFTDMSPRAFNNLPKLTTLYLVDNKLENFNSSWFYKTPAVHLIMLGQNRLRKIQRGAFINLPAIEALDLNRNLIEFIHKDAFIGLRNLWHLNLAENKLKSFDCNFYAPTKLKEVDIRNNNITYISDEVLDVIRPQLSKLIVTDNPLQCACLDKIVQWSDAFNISVPQKKELQQSGAVCVFPKTKPSQCLERGDDDFQEGFWVSFVRERAPVKPFEYNFE
ncbi:hypothetical protein PPYR_04291 [Photinus pyralis]|uniref:LRRCT domain-containing protein n=3 Tax=Photinus pyralis TaxID=7054 RepID=A0A5N4AXL5_PHOPY|nr:leucine-rich repeat-containing G-protein coupled receptor 6-like [Photinus pyralis]KAB0802105.1 hypothetical protein PPYR_04291 [Photinus pyralis]